MESGSYRLFDRDGKDITNDCVRRSTMEFKKDKNVDSYSFYKKNGDCVVSSKSTRLFTVKGNILTLSKIVVFESKEVLDSSEYKVEFSNNNTMKILFPENNIILKRVN